MTLPQALVKGPVRIDNEDPFFCSFVISYKGDDVVAVLIGDLGRALHRIIRMGDVLTEIKAEFKTGGVMYPHQRQVLVINGCLFPEEAKKGRNVNFYA